MQHVGDNTAEEILQKKGLLLLVGLNSHCQQNVKRETSIERFKMHLRSDPVVYAHIC